MSSRKLSNPLALAILACLHEGPMHPYEMATMMRTRGKDQSIKLNYGSLYTVVDALQRNRLIEEDHVERSGRRPERMVYRITPAGYIELESWMVELLGTPHKEYLDFEAGLSLIAVLPPDDVIVLLEERSAQLERELAVHDAMEADLLDKQFPEVFILESNFANALRRAEYTWVQQLLQKLKEKSLGGYELWEGFHQDSDVHQAGEIYEQLFGTGGNGQPESKRDQNQKGGQHRG